MVLPIKLACGEEEVSEENDLRSNCLREEELSIMRFTRRTDDRIKQKIIDGAVRSICQVSRSFVSASSFMFRDIFGTPLFEAAERRTGASRIGSAPVRAQTGGAMVGGTEWLAESAIAAVGEEPSDFSAHHGWA